MEKEQPHGECGHSVANTLLLHPVDQCALRGHRYSWETEGALPLAALPHSDRYLWGGVLCLLAPTAGALNPLSMGCNDSKSIIAERQAQVSHFRHQRKRGGMKAPGQAISHLK